MIEYDKWWHNVWGLSESERATMFNWLHLWLWQFQVNYIFFFSFSASLYARSLHILLVKHKIKQKQKKSQHPSVENQKQFVAFNYDGKYLAYKFYVCDNFQMYKFPLRLGCKYFPFNSSLLIVALLWLVHLRNNNKKKDFFILFSGWYVP